MQKLIQLFLLLMISRCALAAAAVVIPKPSSLVLSVVQNQFIVDKNNVESASVIKDGNGIYRGLRLEIKAEFADAFKLMTQQGVGKTLNVIWNNKIVTAAVIQSPLSANILLSGISRADAQSFIDMLRKG